MPMYCRSKQLQVTRFGVSKDGESSFCIKMFFYWSSSKSIDHKMLEVDFKLTVDICELWRVLWILIQVLI